MQLVELKNFVQATRDSGYASLTQSLAEIVDNSIEADANVVNIFIKKSTLGNAFEISVLDDGHGMTPAGLENAIRFGGTDRFNSRKKFGRYGMGLPNSSLSQSKRLEVYTWRKKPNYYWNYLDVDEVVSGRLKEINESKKAKIPDEFIDMAQESGTLVLWNKIDRFSVKYLTPYLKKLNQALGQIFRQSIYRGLKIIINGVQMRPFDPLYLKSGTNAIGGELYGRTMKVPIRLKKRISNVELRFSELPVVKWSPYSNKEKRNMRITKNAGVSILRNGREIDYGWFFMGKKRKENYDDWWRCEISFNPELDDLFGITHTKQMVNPTNELQEILQPHVESVAHRLNNRVREKFIFLNKIKNKGEAILMAQVNDHLIEPLQEKLKYNVDNLDFDSGEGRFNGYQYTVTQRPLNSSILYDNKLQEDTINIELNDNHPFFIRYLSQMNKDGIITNSIMQKMFYLFILALARSEYFISKKIANSYRLHWGNVLKKYLAK